VPDERKENNMADTNLQRLQKIIKNAEKGLEGGIKSLQQNIKALVGGGLVPPKPKKDLVRALEKLRKGLDKAIRALEKRIAGKSGGRKKSAKRKSAPAA
jgi:hypothetical protein